ncbi:hypothetical protein K1T71_008759 [Dendrolimus kikuchii]|uniref:Uncharacterized protein n=1 Tax=Dendrolimus kikuchii TaxID=765133 RepID=A0ACC1CVM8_9NEOP|nr:hypothetical protein K1T71_008759 [Dendrolimus kikuchii]
MCAPDPSLLRACCLLLCLVAGTRQLSITDFVVPKTVEVGNDVELQCNYELGANSSEKNVFVKWWRTPPPSSGEDRKQLYQRGPDHQARSLQHEIALNIKENDTIVLLDVKPFASGIFECEVYDGDEVRSSQELIVFTKGSGPQLNVTEVEDGPDEDQEVDVLIECSSENAAPLPRLDITIDGKLMNSTERVNGPDETGYYDVFANWTASKSVVKGAEIRCELFYEDEDVAHSPYVDTTTYQPLGAEVSTAEPPVPPPEASATPDSLQNSPSVGGRVQLSAMLFSAMGYAVLLFGGPF